MSKAVMFMIDGFEETEGITPVDILRRGGVEVQTVSLNGDSRQVLSKNAIPVTADATLSDWDADVDMLIIPGGTTAYLDRSDLHDLLRAHLAADRRLAAICAAPAVFGVLGFLEGKRAVCFPGMEHYLKGAIIVEDDVVTDGLFTTSKGPGTAVPFGFELLSLLEGEGVAQQIKEGFLARF